MKHLIVLAGLCLVGCSSGIISEQECASTNWRIRGVTDAWQGKYSSAIQDYQSTCNEYGLNANVAQWKSGYFHTLHQQCTKEKAIHILATSKSAYTGPCMADPDFAKVMHEDKAKIQKEIRIQQIEDRLKEIQVAKSKHQTSGTNGDLSWEEYQLHQELLDLKGTMQLNTPAHINNFLFEDGK